MAGTQLVNVHIGSEIGDDWPIFIDLDELKLDDPSNLTAEHVQEFITRRLAYFAAVNPHDIFFSIEGPAQASREHELTL